MMMNYLIDELAVIGECAIEALSMHHHFFETHDLRKTHYHLQADNCVGQN